MFKAPFPKLIGGPSYQSNIDVIDAYYITGKVMIGGSTYDPSLMGTYCALNTPCGTISMY
jgi:hypothetical protein